MDNPSPLSGLYSKPIELLEKARRDLDRLQRAEALGDLISAKDAVFDCASSTFHVKDWIRATYPELEDAAMKHMLRSPALVMCRDVANASKHYELDPGHCAYRHAPIAVDRADHTAQPEASVAFPRYRLKVRSAHFGDRLAVDLFRDAIGEWQAFLDANSIY